MRRALGSFGALILLAATAMWGVSTSAAAAGTWSSTSDLSAANSNVFGVSPSLAASGQVSLAVWSQTVTGTANTVAQLARSADGGQTWAGAVNLAATSGNTYAPSVALDGSVGVAAWAFDDGAETRIQVSTTSDAGETWTSPVAISATGQVANRPSVAISGSRVLLAWQRSDGSNTRIQAASSADGGATWSSPATLSDAGQNASNAKSALSDSQGVVVWYRSDGTDFRNQAASTSDGGATWSSPTWISPAGTTANLPMLAMSGSTAIVAWETVGSSVQIARTTNAGGSWDTAQTISVGASGFDTPAVAVSGTTALVAWSYNDGSSTRIQVVRSSDAGATWTTPEAVSSTSVTATDPAVSISGSTAGLLWRASSTVQSATSTDSGASWASPVDVSTDTGTPVFTHIENTSRGFVAMWWRSNGFSPGILQGSGLVLPTSSSGTSTSEFVFLLPDGQVCSAISPQVVVNGTQVSLPDENANCRTVGALVIGWRIPGRNEPFPPGMPVNVVDSQQFTAVLEESTVRVHLDANLHIDDTCSAQGEAVPPALRHLTLYLDRPDMDAYAPGNRPNLLAYPAPKSAPCTPPGYTLSHWNTHGDGQGLTIEPGQTMDGSFMAAGTNEVTLYAIWTRALPDS